MAESDNDLLGLVANGDQAAFDRLVLRHRGPLSAFVNRLLGSPSDAEEVVQECLTRVWSHAPRWDPDGSAKAWIFRIAHNLSVDRLRARRPTVDIETREFEDNSPTPEQALSSKRVEHSVRDAVAALPERQRIAISLFHLKDMTADEVAHTMGISVDALESLLRRARAKLKEIVRQEQPEAFARTATGERR